MPASMSATDLKLLSTCSQCGTKEVDMICVPGGWMQLICRVCHNEWWVESNKIHLH
jgi:hypothetical protein